jgi:hypothetical protein
MLSRVEQLPPNHVADRVLRAFGVGVVVDEPCAQRDVLVCEVDLYLVDWVALTDQGDAHAARRNRPAAQRQGRAFLLRSFINRLEAWHLRRQATPLAFQQLRR